VPIVEWTLLQCAPDLKFRVEVAKQGMPPLKLGLKARIAAAVKFFPCQILLIHRDSEAIPRNDRLAEIEAEAAGHGVTWVGVIPVRMSEAWLFSDEVAIRQAANNPNGAIDLELPRAREWETLTDPKQRLFDTLLRATGLNARRRGRFDVHRARSRVTELTPHFEGLRAVQSFRHFEGDLRAALLAHGWVTNPVA
jgi:hypothetical protein